MRSVACIGSGIVVVLFCSAACERTSSRSAPAELTMATERVVEPMPPPPEPEPVRTVDVPVPGDLPAFVVRGARQHRVPMLFLAGMCVHPAGYVMSFQNAAAERGDVLGLQGDVSCGGDDSMRRWSYDLDAMDRRVDAAFEAAGLRPPRDVIVIGYSQGAERAEKLVARWPTKYSRAILIASPVTPSPQNLRHAQGIVLMSGTYDMALGRMRGAVAPLQRANVPTTFLAIDNARHGQMGDAPEETMRRALDFVETAARTTSVEGGH